MMMLGFAGLGARGLSQGQARPGGSFRRLNFDRVLDDWKDRRTAVFLFGHDRQGGDIVFRAHAKMALATRNHQTPARFSQKSRYPNVLQSSS